MILSDLAKIFTDTKRRGVSATAELFVQLLMQPLLKDALNTWQKYFVLLRTLQSCYRWLSAHHHRRYIKIYRVWLKIDAVRGKPQFDSYESFFAKFCSNRFTFVEIVPDNPNLGSRTILTRDTDIGILFVRLSVRPSVHNAPVLDENGLTYRHSFFSPYGSPIILVLPASNIFTKFRRGHPLQRR